VKVARQLTQLRPARAARAALLWLTDTLDWLDLWQYPAAGDELAGDLDEHGPNNHLSPRL
jgi:hypothetical protein